MSTYFIVIPTGNKRKTGSQQNGEETFHHPFHHPSILAVLIKSIGSEEFLLILVLLIHINTHNRMEINYKFIILM